jgi:putative ABC transport system substrate-binding protein
VRRREFIALFGGVSIAGPLAPRAQSPAIPVVGFLSGGSPETLTPLVSSFRQGLSEIGYVEGRNVAIEYRWAEGHYDRLPAMAADLAARKVAVIAAPGSTPGALAAEAATKTVPIAFATGTDPVKLGLVASLNRPGGNATGISFFGSYLGPKQLEVLREILPNATVIAALINPTNPAAEVDIEELQNAATRQGVRLVVLNAASESDFDGAFATLIQQRAAALLVAGDALFTGRFDRLISLALQHLVPTVYFSRKFAVAGGLMSYGTSLPDAYRQVGVYVGRILNGAKPADLPVQRAVKVELIINLKTAKALGLTIPPSLLARADEVIE